MRASKVDKIAPSPPSNHRGLDCPIHRTAALMPSMTEAELADLAQDIAENGLLHPIVLCRNGHRGHQVLDGRHRLLALKSPVCRQAGIEPKFVVWEPTNGQTPLEYVLSANLKRRHLTVSQRAALAVHILPMLEVEARERKRAGGRDLPVNLPEGQPAGQGDTRDQAGTLLGVSGKYVSTAKRVRMEDPDVFEHVLSGHLGLEPAQQMLEVPTQDRPEVLRRLPAEGQAVTRQVVRHLAAALHRENLSNRAAAVRSLPDGLQLMHGDFRVVGEAIPDGTLDLVFCDPEYAEAALSLWRDLAAWAARKLRDDGLFLAYTPHAHLRECLDALSGHLDYQWICGVHQTGGTAPEYHRRIWITWKPLLLFSRGRPREHDYFNDMIRGEPPDKSLHEWAQSSAEAEYFIERLTEPGMTVCDPVMGSGTIPLAAFGLNRRALGIEIDEERYKVALATAAEEAV